MRFGGFPIRGSFATMVLLTAMCPSGFHFGAFNKSIAQDDTSSVEETDPAKNAPSIRFSAGTERTIKAEQALKRNVSFQFDETPFVEVKRKLESLSGLNFILNQSATDDSLTSDVTISIELTDVPLNKALSLLLGSKNATYVIDDGIVVLISLDDAEDVKWLRLKMYDCRDLVEVLLANNRPDPNGEQTLLDMVQSFVGPNSWIESGQGTGTIVLVNGTLVVKQTEEFHQQIEKFLADLEASVLLRTRPCVIKTGTKSEFRPNELQTKNENTARVFNLPPVSSAKTANQLLQQLETHHYIKPTLSLSTAELGKAVEQLKDRFPLRSIRDRLHFQEGEPAASDYRAGYADRRASALQSLHSESVDSFINQSGQGVTRITPIGPQDLFSQDRSLAKRIDAIPVESAFHFEEVIEIDKTIKMQKSRYRARMGEMDPDDNFINSLSPDGLPRQQVLSVFNRRAADSFANQRTGIVKNIDEVAGFESHRIRFEFDWLGNLRPSDEILKARGIEATGLDTAWKVNRFQLVSLLMHDQPCVYDVDELPNMENLNSETASIRPLNDFEAAGIKALESGEELLVRATKNRILMIGAIRAGKKCLACHTENQNDLLGAFSYEFLRQPRTQSQPVKKKN